MLGVVLWSDAKVGKAVFWCEDQGDLAYYETAPSKASGHDFFDAGDLVQFEVSVDQHMRRASNASLVKEKACCELPDQLRHSARKMDSTAATAEIIPFTAAAGQDAQQKYVRPRRLANA